MFFDRPKYKRFQHIRGTGNRSSLWIAEDHLLYAETLELTEQYKRFYFRDIQCLRYVPIWSWTIVNAISFGILGLGILPPIIVGMSGSSSVDLLVSIGPLLVIFLGIGLVNLCSGANAKVQIVTHYGTYDLQCPNRAAKVRKLIKKIRPLIISAQGEADHDEVVQQLIAASQEDLALEPIPQEASLDLGETPQSI